MNATAHGRTNWPRLLGHALLLTLGSLAAFTLLLAATWLPHVGGFFWFLTGCFALFLWPLWLVPLHLRWQRPPETSVTLAFVTALTCWIVSSLMMLYAALVQGLVN